MTFFFLENCFLSLVLTGSRSCLPFSFLLSQPLLSSLKSFFFCAGTGWWFKLLFQENFDIKGWSIFSSRPRATMSETRPWKFRLEFLFNSTFSFSYLPLWLFFFLTRRPWTTTKALYHKSESSEKGRKIKYLISTNKNFSSALPSFVGALVVFPIFRCLPVMFPPKKKTSLYGSMPRNHVLSFSSKNKVNWVVYFHSNIINRLKWNFLKCCCRDTKKKTAHKLESGWMAE